MTLRCEAIGYAGVEKGRGVSSEGAKTGYLGQASILRQLTGTPVRGIRSGLRPRYSPLAPSPRNRRPHGEPRP